MKPWNEIGHRNIQEAGGGQCEKVRQHSWNEIEGDAGGDGTEAAGGCRQHVEQQRSTPRVTRVKQDGEVSDLLRDFVRRYRKCRADAKGHGRQDRCGHNGSIDEIVEGITNEYWEHGAVVHLAVMCMAVTPEHKLFEEEEKEDANQQRSQHSRCRQLLES